MQSRRTWLPRISGPVRFAEAAALANAVLADPAGSDPIAGGTVLVGPEGGFTPDESSAVPTRVRLAPGILRVETAAVAAAVLLVNNP